jgi:hypothetical protein
MCLKKSILKQLLQDYPDAQKYYKERAWARRIEFRRLMKIHLIKTEKNPNMGQGEDTFTESQSGESTYSSEYSDEEQDGDDGQDKGGSAVENKGQKKVKMYGGMEDDYSDGDESEIDIDTDELERYSEDEIFDNRAEILKESNKKKSQQSAEKIQQQMVQMSSAFEQMNTSLQQNLQNVNKHIKDV